MIHKRIARMSYDVHVHMQRRYFVQAQQMLESCVHGGGREQFHDCKEEDTLNICRVDCPSREEPQQTGSTNKS